MHQPAGPNDFAAKDLADALVPETDPEQRSRRAKAADKFIRDARLRRVCTGREKCRCVPASARRLSSTVISSFRLIIISTPISPKYCTRL